MSNDEDTLREEYPEELIRSGVRGKYTASYRKGTNVVLIDPQVEEAWRLEIERRVGQIDHGEVQLIPGDGVFARLRRRLACFRTRFIRIK